MRRLALPLLALALALPAGGPAQEEPAFIYGMHDPGAEKLMLDAGAPGWIVFCEELGCDPNAKGGRDYLEYTRKGFGCLVRLNYGYHPKGTLPPEKEYDNFAQRCANFVRDSRGARHWIIGNETNLKVEWPRVDGKEEPITAERYVKCFKKVRKAIHSVPGHEKDLVIVQGTGPWNYEAEFWIDYHKKILKGIGSEVDGIALHTYSQGYDARLVTSDEKREKDGCYAHFRAYIDFMNTIPKSLRRKPVWITETNGGVDGWKKGNVGWIEAAYAEINRWNKQRGTQKIRALCLYRWLNWDRWGMETLPEVHKDFQAAMKKKYRWK